MTYVVRDPEVQRQLRDRHLHAEDHNARGPTKEQETYHGDAFEINPTVGTWNKDGVSAGIFPLAGKLYVNWIVLISSSGHCGPLSRQKDVDDNLEAGSASHHRIGSSLDNSVSTNS
jgi:hypothetical protein